VNRIDLDGKRAVVTGGAQGIGRAIAERLAREPVTLLVGVRSLDRYTPIEPQGAVEVRPVAMDLGSRESIDASCDALGEELGRIDVLVNNAGGFVAGQLETQDLDDIYSLVQSTFLGTLHLTRRVLPGMLARGSGHLVTLGSIADRAVFPGNAAYAASKHGARALHEVLRAELRGSGVRASLVSPGPVDTELWDEIDPDNQPGFTPRAQMLRPADVADAVRWVVLAPAIVNVDELRLSRS
jgi:NADP-dependent 3-hydroxy acid dehydrogenase YdfG